MEHLEMYETEDLLQFVLEDFKNGMDEIAIRQKYCGVSLYIKKLPPDVKQRIHQFYKEGWSVLKIRQYFRVSTNYVYTVLREMNNV